MSKPWAKTEIDFINHPKFRALNANAICLWIEGKNYCDKHMTDGLIPAHIVKQFRFSGTKSVRALLESCGPKNESETYSPLWAEHPVGYKMHDYLDYNDCRDVVVARLDQADERRQKENERLKHWRAIKKAKAEETKSETVLETAVETVVKRVSHAPRNGNETLYTETATATSTKKEQNSASPVGVASPANHPIKAFLTLYEELFVGLFGNRPVLTNGRDAKIAKNAIAQLGDDKARSLLRAFFASDDQFIVKSGYGLNIFAGQINKLLTDERPRQLAATGTDGRGRTGAPPKGKYDGIEEHD